MSAIAHWIEQESISTTVIGLIKPHLEKIQPPRALWVPFELGRPLGPPNKPDFQRQVLQQALELVEHCSEQTLKDFALDDPNVISDQHWNAPDVGECDSVTEELKLLQPAYQRHCVNNSRTSVGVAKLPISDLAELFDSVSDTGKFKPLREDISGRLTFRLALDDLKSYYVEAALADHYPSSRQISDWLWHDTLLGKRMRELRKLFMQSDDTKIKDFGTKFIVPHRWRD